MLWYMTLLFKNSTARVHATKCSRHIMIKDLLIFEFASNGRENLGMLTVRVLKLMSNGMSSRTLMTSETMVKVGQWPG